MLPECQSRLSHPKMEYYREVYKHSERWNGIDSLDGKTIIVYCEQGFGDTIQFCRYFSLFKNCEVILHCPLKLHRLLSQFKFKMIDRNDPNIPKHDFHVLSMSLPFCFEEGVEIKHPYIHITEKTDLHELNLPDDIIKIGIKWEGNPEHSNNEIRCCPLIFFKKLADKFPKIKFFALHNVFHNLSYLDGCDDLELYSSTSEDFYDTAMFINAMDMIITTDTSALHLAGALNKKTIGLLSNPCDERWNININWYPSVEFIKQDLEGDWELVFYKLENYLTNLF
jgi:hypothetical protein